MAENAQEQLLGYLLDALEDDERQQLQQELANDPQLRQQLQTIRAALQPLESTREPVEPPPGLARRTCRYVAAEASGSEPTQDSRPAPHGRLHAMRADARLDGGSSRFSWLDLAAAAGILVAASLLIFPALLNSRVQARTAQCGNNLHSIYQALASYSDNFGGSLPSAPPSDRLAVGGGFAPVLHTAGYLNEPRQLLCPGSPMAELPAFAIPTPKQIYSMPEGAELDTALANLASYSMSMGYEEDGRYHGLQNLGRSDFALISDVPDPTSVSFRSHNHPGGQNILFEGGNVRYVTVPVSTVGNDHYYLNAAGRIGPGLNRYDSVIPPAGRVPIVYASNR